MLFFIFSKNNADNNIAFGDGRGEIGNLKLKAHNLEEKTFMSSLDISLDPISTSFSSELTAAYDVTFGKNLTVTGILMATIFQQ
jgi:hypothetical protein